MKLVRIHIGRPQRLAALLLLCFFGECLWVIHHQELSTVDYRYARCGREMWERPSLLAGYFTTCGNLNGDGTFAYRAAGLPLTLERAVLLSVDHFRAPADRLYPGGSLNGSTWEARHELASVVYLIHLPFVFFGLWLGGGLWWVARRLFGNEGGFFALALYCFCPAVVSMAVTPNNDVLAMWGLYGVIYTAIGVAHAMQGPRRKWRPRIALLTLALGLTAAAHLLAAIFGFVAAIAFTMYLAEYRRSSAMQVLILAAVGALAIVFAFYGFRLPAFSYVFTGGAARFWFSLAGVSRFVTDVSNLPIMIASAIAVLAYALHRPSRYFGNTAPLLVLLALAPLVTTQIVSAPWVWALPFLFTFLGGVFSDVLESRQRKLFIVIAGGIVVAQALECILALALIAG